MVKANKLSSRLKTARKIIERLIRDGPDSPEERPRCITAVARTVLLNVEEPYMYNGVAYTVKAKSLGAGVYEVYLEKGGE